jgi:hypothetical protein
MSVREQGCEECFTFVCVVESAAPGRLQPNRPIFPVFFFSAAATSVDNIEASGRKTL